MKTLYRKVFRPRRACPAGAEVQMVELRTRFFRARWRPKGVPRAPLFAIDSLLSAPPGQNFRSGGVNPPGAKKSYLRPTVQPSYLQPSSVKPALRAGFTLVEMLVVIVIIAILIGMLGGAYIQARNHAKRGRAETQLRELVKAWNQYYMTYTNFPSSGTVPVPMTYANLQPLLASDTTDNPKGIPFLSISLQSGATYCDPWGNPYYITFGSQQAPQEVAMRIAVSFPNRNRYR
jgi:prepilin-type N-terminal cleavage/methylation domain-containing protein